MTAPPFLSFSTTPASRATTEPSSAYDPAVVFNLSLLSCPSVAQGFRATPPMPPPSNGHHSLPSRDQPRPLDPARLDSPPLRCEAADSALRFGPSKSQLTALTSVCSLWMLIGSPRCSPLQSWNRGCRLCWLSCWWWSAVRSTVQRATKLDSWFPFSCCCFLKSEDGHDQHSY